MKIVVADFATRQGTPPVHVVCFEVGSDDGRAGRFAAEVACDGVHKTCLDDAWAQVADAAAAWNALRDCPFDIAPGAAYTPPKVKG